MSPGRLSNYYMALGLLLLVTVLLYARGLQGPMVLDDPSSLKPLLEAGHSGDWAAAFWSDTGPSGRPIATLTLLLNGWLGGTSLYWVKLINVLIHLVNTLLLADIARRLHGALFQQGTEAGHRWFGLAVAAVWCLHPLQVSTVLYGIQRMTELSALLALVAVRALLQLRDLPGRARLPPMLVLIMATGLAPFAKENGALVPLLLLLVASLLRGAGVPLFSVREQRALGIIVLLLTAGLVFYLLLVADFGRHPAYAGRGFTALERLGAEGPVLWMYIGSLLLPTPGRMPFFYDDLQVGMGGLSHAGMLTGWIGWVLVATAAFLLRRRLPLAVLGIGWFLIAHSLEASFIALELAFEHRNYLPSAGLALALVAGLEALLASRTLVVGIVVAWLMASSVLLALRVGSWSSLPRLVVDSYNLRPHSPGAAAAMAEVLSAQRPDVAERILQGNTAPGARLQQLCIRCRQHGQLSEADLALLPATDAVIRIDNYGSTGISELVGLIIDDHCKAPAATLIQWLQTIVTRGAYVHESGKVRAVVYLGHLLWHEGQQELAIATLMQHWTPQSMSPMARLLAAEWQAESGDCRAAAEGIRMVRLHYPGKAHQDWADSTAETLQAHECR
jgi:protein O-mannosyl-transferase